MRTFDEGLNYLHQAKKEHTNRFFVQAKLAGLWRLAGFIGGAGKLFSKKAKVNVETSKEIIHETTKKLRHSPWRALAYVVCISFVAGVVSRRVLARRKI